MINFLIMDDGQLQKEINSLKQEMEKAKQYYKETLENQYDSADLDWQLGNIKQDMQKIGDRQRQCKIEQNSRKHGIGFDMERWNKVKLVLHNAKVRLNCYVDNDVFFTEDCIELVNHIKHLESILEIVEDKKPLKDELDKQLKEVLDLMKSDLSQEDEDAGKEKDQ